MTFMEKVSMKLAIRLREQDSPYTYGQLAHGIEIFLFTLLNLVVLMLFSFLFDIFYESMTLITLFYVLRLFSGGAHLKSPWACLLVGLGLMLAGGFLLKNLPVLSVPSARVWLLLVLGVSFWANYRYAPAKHTYAPDNENIKRRSRKILLSILVICCFLAIALLGLSYKLSMTFTLAVLLQSCLLLPVSIQWIHRLEKYFGKGGIG